MKDIKEVYAKELNNIMKKFLTHINKDRKGMSLEELYLFMLGATQTDVAICFNKIVKALPDNFFITRQGSKEQIKEELVKEFILFIAQEDITSKEFDHHFANFIYFVGAEVGYKYKMLH